MEYMKTCKDNQFDLAIVDPPYGSDKIFNGSESFANRYKQFDNTAPSPEYFDELFRTSKSQIIWGANNFILPITRGFVVWDKVKFAKNYSQCEYAWTSFDCVARIFKFCSNGGFVVKAIDTKIHPTQKPVALYKWLLQNYAKPGDKLFDSHSGSGSFRIAAHDLGFDLVSCELDPDYYRDNEARYQNHIKQGDLFDTQEIQNLVFKANK
jgi:site-specific DNA-methyltransferase (adenine-specific)